MKKIFLPLAAALFLFGITNLVQAQGLFNIQPTDLGNSLLKEKLEKAARTALSKNPDLIKERQEITLEFNKLKGQGKKADPDDIKDLLDRQRAYEKKWHAALVDADPTLKSYFDELEAKKNRKK